MEGFYAGFEKQAGLSDWIQKVKTFFTREKPEQPKQQNIERTPPKYFYSKKLDSGHIKNVNKAIRNNYRGGTNNLIVKYKKADGSVVERKITPYTAKNTKLLLAHDHYRNDIRSFRVDRIQGLRRG